MKSLINLITGINIPKVPFLVGMFGTIIFTIISLSVPILTKDLIDNFTNNSNNNLIIITIAIIFILQSLLDGITTYSLSYVGLSVVSKLRERIWRKFIHLPVQYFDHNTSGESVSRIISDSSIVKELVSIDFPQAVRGFITIVGAVILLLWLDWQMTIMLLVAIPLAVAIIVPLGRKISSISRGLQDETAKFSSHIQQTLSEIRLMKLSTAEKFEEEKGLKGINNLFKFGLKESRILSLLSPFMYTTMMVVLVIVIAYGGIRVAEGSMTTGTLVAFVIYAFQINHPISLFAMFFTKLQKAKGATERIINILEQPEELVNRGIELDITNRTLTLSNISFSYHKDEPVLQNVSFNAKPGEMVAIVGPSGAGKTTIFSLIERFYIPNEGQILIDDLPIEELTLQSWRSQIGYVSQDSAMIAGTIRENITYGLPNTENISDEQLWEVCRMAFADEFIKRFSKQLDTVVGERGVMLSGGQRQRINIVRAFLRDPKILMLDEATASLDTQSEGIVQEALSRLMKGRTTLVIAHRLSTIVNADQILFLENGKITGIGKHHDLMKRHALYREYAEHQLV
ncbi:ABC transporter ATP-binding protein [Bacillaceae bacterium W0354]